MTFEEDVIDRLARMEVNLLDLPKIKAKMETLEAHRNYLAGAMGVLSVVGGYLFHLKV